MNYFFILVIEVVTCAKFYTTYFILYIVGSHFNFGYTGSGIGKILYNLWRCIISVWAIFLVLDVEAVTYAKFYRTYVGLLWWHGHFSFDYTSSDVGKILHNLWRSIISVWIIFFLFWLSRQWHTQNFTGLMSVYYYDMITLIFGYGTQKFTRLISTYC